MVARIVVGPRPIISQEKCGLSFLVCPHEWRHGTHECVRHGSAYLQTGVPVHNPGPEQGLTQGGAQGAGLAEDIQAGFLDQALGIVVSDPFFLFVQAGIVDALLRRAAFLQLR